VGAVQGKKILVTGGAGFIGSNLVLRLCARENHVTVIDSFSPGSGANPFNLEPVKNQISLRRVDLAREEDLRACLAGESYDFVFNLAGSVSHLDSLTHPAQDLANNVVGHLNLLECLKGKKTKIIYSSTRQVYGKPGRLPVNEKDPVRPLDLNGIHKFCAEEYHRLYRDIHGLPSVSLRLTNTYGPRQLIRESNQGVAGFFLGAALRGEKIRLFDGGKQRRDFCFVDDVVDALLLAAASPACDGGVFNLSGEICSLRRFAEILARLVPGTRMGDEDFPADRKRIDIGEYAGDSSLFSSLTGWKAGTGLEAGLRATVEFYRKHSREYL
jgi:UDP-glucose 4-epimerase